LNGWPELGLPGRAPPNTRARARRGPGASGRAQRGSGECGELGHGHSIGTGAVEGGGPRRGGLAAAQLYSEEQSRTTEGRQWENRGEGRLVTSRGVSGTLEWQHGHGEASGRQRRSCCCAEEGPVTERNRGGGGEPRGVPGC
jgi:hypothetical protein